VSLILCGFKSCGKSTFGKAAADKLGKPFLDVDQLIEERFLEERSLPLRCHEIYEALGEKGFRDREKDIIASLTSQPSAIIATGGGAILDPENVRLLKKLGKIIYLHVDKEILKERIFRTKIPSFLDASDPLGSFEKVFKERDPIYRAASDLVLFLGGSADETILEALCQQAGV
jgi:shikimate kinase